MITARFRYDHKPDQRKARFRYDPLLLGYLHHLTKKTHKPFLGVEKRTKVLLYCNIHSISIYTLEPMAQV